MELKRVCVVAHFAYGAIMGGRGGHVGGVERQTSLLCRWLAGRGIATSLVVWGEGGKSEETVDGVRILHMCRKGDGIPGLRFFHPRWTSLVDALRRADAQLYYQNCAEYVTGQVALWCRAHRRAFVYSVASDPDCDPRLPEMRTLRERILYRYGLRKADRVVAQTERQREMLLEGFGVESTVLPMPCPDPPSPLEAAPHGQGGVPFRVAWVGRIAPVKRIELLLQAARLMPEVRFDVAGGVDGGDPAVEAALRLASTLPNVVLHGPLDRERLAALYRQSSLLCCTSRFEGFPNTFLEAWSHGLPIVSTVDPDGVIGKEGLGVVVEDAQGIASAVRALRDDEEFRTAVSRKALRHFRERHSLEPAMARFLDLFREALRRRDARAEEGRS